MNINTPVATIYGDWTERFGAQWKNQISLIQHRFGSGIKQVLFPGEQATDVPILVVEKQRVLEVLGFLKSDPALEYEVLSDLTATDEGGEPRFRVVYQLFSITKKMRIRVKVELSEGEMVPTAVALWLGANWAEREVFDMFGIRFEGHPDLRRIVMDERWVGHPLRKDYPLRGYQLFQTPEPINTKLLD